MKILALIFMTILLTACGSSPNRQTSNSTSYPTSYNYSPYTPPKPAVKPTVSSVASPAGKPQPNLPTLNFDDLVRFEYDCSRRMAQLDLLQEQIRKKTFYRVDGVDGNEFPDRINKRYYALVRYRMWSLRLGCSGSSVEKHTEIKLKAGSPTRPPESMPRCYFEEIVVAKSEINLAEGGGESVVSKRKEFCTNYPLIADRRIVNVGDQVDPERQLDKNIPYIPNLRKWNGNIFQLFSKTEMHLNDVVKFTVVVMWSKSGWVVVDKF
jgi:hypothetical protein